MPLIQSFRSRRCPLPVGPTARRLRRAGWASAVLLAVGGASPVAGPTAAQAAAGEYHAYLCQTPSGRNAPLDGVRFSNTEDWYGYGNHCGQPGGTINLQMGDLPRGTGARIRASLEVPGYLSIAGGDFRRRVRMNDPVGGEDFSATPTWLVASESPSGALYHDGCAWWECRSLDWPSSGTKAFESAPNTTRLLWEFSCAGNPGGGCRGSNGNRAEAEVFAVHLRLRDVLEPGLDAAGPAFQSDPTVHGGVENAVVRGYDTGGGVYQSWVKIDGVEVVRRTVGGTCADQGNRADTDLDFERVVPCPSDATLTLPVDTRTVPDGRHTIQAFVRDAAGNIGTLPEQSITTENVPPPKALQAPVVTAAGSPLTDLRPGDQLIVSDGTWEGTNLRFTYQWQRSGEGGWSDIPLAVLPRYQVAADDIGHQLRVLVRATNAEGETAAQSNATGTVKSGASVRPQSLAPTSTPAEGSPQLVVDREQRSVQVSRGAKIVVTGRLVDADGRPIADADVEVFEQVSVVGAAWRKVATVKTDGQGGYVFRPTTTASRTLRFAYSARRESGDYRATREVVIAVAAGMRLRAVPRTVRRGGVLRLRGRVLVDELPAAGTWVEVQVLDAGVWRTVGTRRTSASGKWSFRHRVQRVSGVTFTFRARLRQAADVPATESKSAPVKVRVR